MVSRRAFLAASGAAALSVPLAPSWLAAPAHAAPPTCQLALENTTLPGQINAYVSGRELGTDRLIFLRADGSAYYPETSSAQPVPLPVDCSIPLGPAGSGPRVLTMGHIYSGRIYFVRDNVLDFFLVRTGDGRTGLVEPSFSNPADVNYNRTYAFAEFTFNTVQIYANISYVNIVTALPIGLALDGDVDQTVAAMPEGAVDRIADGLTRQAAADGQPWDQLVIRGSGGNVLRIISPQDLMAAPPNGGTPFAGYWAPYVNQVWDRYRTTDLRIDLQGGRGVLAGRVNGDVLTFQGGHTFARPNDRDIFTCDSGPFANVPSDSDEKKAILARLAAGFNRSIMLSHPEQPNGVTAADYYRDPITNHWARVIHANTPIGYAFPYDDVRPDGQPDVSGAVHDGNPVRFTVRAGQ
ncbi:glycoside hydrolase family 64 protein [Allonocardiopsis opalescens]|uniref:Beta-1,3-glucanase n=1 Tax=Allonocardiopsis opalescens TaxID=1144618 RepID=A0A2T0PS75_9ACTN|nr:glycoside hydrolase family 64 protein [Allonocardiopsis opalescens]PRX91753.1 beta-1,3-glucanase [Allonocardiopsis opalescens]